MRCSSRLSSVIAPRRAEVELGALRDAPAATSEKRGTFVGGMDRYRAVMAEVVSDAGWQAGDAAGGGAVSFPSAVGIASADLFALPGQIERKPRTVPDLFGVALG